MIVSVLENGVDGTCSVIEMEMMLHTSSSIEITGQPDQSSNSRSQFVIIQPRSWVKRIFLYIITHVIEGIELLSIKY